MKSKNVLKINLNKFGSAITRTHTHNVLSSILILTS